MTRSPIRTFTLASSMAAGCIFAWFAAYRFNSMDPISEGLEKIEQQSESIGADAEQLQEDLDLLVDMYGLDAILSEPSNGRTFIRIGKKINELQMRYVESLHAAQEAADLRSSSN